MAGYDVKQRIWTVSEMNRFVATLLGDEPLLHGLRLRGQVSGFKEHYSGAWYFDLKDAASSVSCAMFRTQVQRAGFVPRNGDQVIVTGRAGLYEAGGRYQFYVDLIRPEGTGSLWQRYEETRERLQAEGLFAESRKRPLPVRPRRIAVVTAESGAVIHDIIRVSRSRDPGVAIVLVPVPVQGAAAAPKLVEGIRRAGELPGIDLVIVGRGGGSMEDLWCFNEEAVVRAIAACPRPVISAVGHETDVTLADFAADRRAATPSHAAEMAVPDVSDALEGLRMIRVRLDRAAEARLSEYRLTLSALRGMLTEQDPRVRLQENAAALTALRGRMEHAADRALAEPVPRLGLALMRLDTAADRSLHLWTERVARDRTRLQALSPTAVLERGYAYVTAGSRVVTRAADAPEKMNLCFADGSVRVRREDS